MFWNEDPFLVAHKKSKSELLAFQWDKLMTKLQEQTPTLLTLMSAVSVSIITLYTNLLALGDHRQ